jgi:hypothetical protein
MKCNAIYITVASAALVAGQTTHFANSTTMAMETSAPNASSPATSFGATITSSALANCAIQTAIVSFGHDIGVLDSDGVSTDRAISAFAGTSSEVTVIITGLQRFPGWLKAASGDAELIKSPKTCEVTEVIAILRPCFSFFTTFFGHLKARKTAFDIPYNPRKRAADTAASAIAPVLSEIASGISDLVTSLDTVSGALDALASDISALTDLVNQVAALYSGAVTSSVNTTGTLSTVTSTYIVTDCPICTETIVILPEMCGCKGTTIPNCAKTTIIASATCDSGAPAVSPPANAVCVMATGTAGSTTAALCSSGACSILATHETNAATSPAAGQAAGPTGVGCAEESCATITQAVTVIATANAPVGVGAGAGPSESPVNAPVNLSNNGVHSTASFFTVAGVMLLCLIFL